ncbi:MAG: hypothetical protein UHD64_00240 [Bacteroidales bacterium]|nr:hypothetical protein [Bacteroidales bacterium]
MVKSEKIYSPQNYLELVTGNCYIIKGCNDIETIECVLEDLGYSLRSYPLSEISHIVEEELNVVLVDCMVCNDDKDEFEHVYRWFEVDVEAEMKSQDYEYVVYDEEQDCYVCPQCGEYVADRFQIKDLDYDLPKHCHECGTKLHY